MRVVNMKIYRITRGELHPVLVELVTDEGITGWGEAAVAYGIGAQAVAGMLADLSPKVIGADPSFPRNVYHEVYDHSFWTKGGGAIVFAALSAIDQALWDIKAKSLGVPVWELFGGNFHDSIPVYANGWNYRHDDVLEWARAAERPLKEGYTMLKTYPLAVRQPNGTLRHVTRRALSPEAFDVAVRRMRTLKEVVGDQAEILVDLSGGLNNDQLIRFMAVCEETGVSWVEEPLDPFNLGGLRELRGRWNIPIAAGERIYTRNGFKNLLETGGVDIVMPDVGNCGGIFELVQIAAMAEAHNARVSPHNCASSLCTAVSMQAWMATASPMPLETYPYFPEANNYVQVLKNPPESRISNGKLEVPREPGLGVEIDRERLTPFLAHDLAA
ncbi:mandelate racemase/muconate lactonizing enzyme family protein [Hoeflea olei]|uniref:Dehydratase n=1 Tax=Hoeflea olei TaxID=1480615 RepID=A0A1C1YT31_9HYPH|nr:mandelate racemase/muconate lactonizing enzyme family protein [Hoeflea olei]OCW56678.1 dehydratase [Hoeflea olei]